VEEYTGSAQRCITMMDMIEDKGDGREWDGEEEEDGSRSINLVGALGARDR
jgi:hypothetical protein